MVRELPNPAVTGRTELPNAGSESRKPAAPPLGEERPNVGIESREPEPELLAEKSS
jgi:hypothetical protein